MDYRYCDHAEHLPLDPPLPVRTAVGVLLHVQGFALVSGQAFVTLGNFGRRWSRLAESWDSLPADVYMADRGGYRRRRFREYHLTAEKTTLSLRPSDRRHYRQDVTINPLNGGIDRMFAPIDLEVELHRTLLQLVCTDWQQLPEEMRRAHRDWYVDVHQVRITATPEREGSPTPEGFHQDGEQFGVQHFVSRSGIDGGEFMVRDLDGEQRARWLQSDALDSVYLEDARVRHAVTPVVAQPGVRCGWRDVLLVGFNPVDRQNG